jgi:hypothetical protein
MATIEQVLQRTEDTLATAKYGYQDLISGERSRRFSGLRNLIVFGRSVTFVLQNLRSSVGKERFDSWYEPQQEMMKSDLVLKYFVKLRNDLEKQGKLPVSTSAHLKNFSSDTLDKYKKPPGTVGFFIGDQMGGSGFEVELLDGSKEKYYVELPSDVASVTQHFHELPLPEDDELKNKTIEELSGYFISKLETLLDNAREEFIGHQVKTVNGKRLPTYLRVVK